MHREAGECGSCAQWELRAEGQFPTILWFVSLLQRWFVFLLEVSVCRIRSLSPVFSLVSSLSLYTWTWTKASLLNASLLPVPTETHLIHHMTFQSVLKAIVRPRTRSLQRHMQRQRHIWTQLCVSRVEFAHNVFFHV